MTDIWVCADCRSINPRRSDRCYKCRAPRPPEGEEMAAASLPALQTAPEPPPTLLRSTTADPLPESRVLTASSRAAINPAARSATMPAAVAGVVLMIAVIGLRLLLARTSLDLTGDVISGEAIDESEIGLLGTLGLIYPLLGVLAIGGLGYWASRVVANIPLLGGGWPRFTPGQALIEHVIPGWNVLRTPGVYREMQVRLSPDGRSNDLLILAWVVVNIAAVVIVRPIGSTLASFASTADDYVGMITLVSYLSIGLQAIAVLFMVLLIVEIEGQQTERVKTLAAEAASASRATAAAAARTAPEVRAALAARPLTAIGGSRFSARDEPARPAEPAGLDDGAGEGESAGPDEPEPRPGG